MQSECTVGVHSRGAQPTGSEEQVRDRATAMPMEGCSLFMKPPDASRRFRASTRKAPAPDTKRRLRGAEPGRRLEKRITAVPSVGEEPRSLLYRWVRSRDLLRYPRGTEHVIPEGGSPLFYYNGPGLDVHVSRTRQLHYYYHGGAALASSFSLFFESASRSLHSSRSARSTGACRVRRHISRSSISSERIPVDTPVSHSATPRFPARSSPTLSLTQLRAPAQPAFTPASSRYHALSTRFRRLARMGRFRLLRVPRGTHARLLHGLRMFDKEAGKVYKRRERT